MAKAQGAKRYAVYLRCSSDDQAQGDFTTIDTQREINTRYVAEHGGVLVKEYFDEGKTGTNLKRPGWKQLLADAQCGMFNAVCVTYMSRLGRGEAFTVAEWNLRDEGVSVEMVKEKFTDDMAGYINKTMTRFMDGMYPQMVSQWTRTKQEQMVQHGYFCGGIVPFGYRSETVEDAAIASRNGKEPPRRLVPDTDAASFVRRAFEVFVDTHSFNRVAEYLRSVTPRLWTVNAVRHILHNDVYRGVLRHGVNVNHTAFEPIVSEALWDKVQTADAVRLPRCRKEFPKDTTPYYLRGIVYCSHCGCRMTPASHHGMNAKVRYYECLCSMKKLTQDCPSRRVNAAALHNAVISEIARCGQHPTRIQGYLRQAANRLPDVSDSAKELLETRKQAREVDKRIAQLAAAIEAGGSLRSLLERLAALETQRVTLDARLLHLDAQQAERTASRPEPKQIAEVWCRFAEVWEKLTEEEREKVMSLLVERVDVTGKSEGTCRIRIPSKVPSPVCNLLEPWEPVPQDTANYPTLRLEVSVNARKRGRAKRAA